MMLELSRHAASSFVTLTYKDAPRDLVPEDMQAFLKRLRARRGPFRFYGTGEYGKKEFRPHYHLALFGVCMTEEATILDCWGHGFIHVGELNKMSAMYLTKYVCKSVGELIKHGDRVPEFARMSRNPGIGAPVLDEILENLVRAHGGSCDQQDIGDVPTVLRIEGRRYPVGTFLRRKLRAKLGWDESAPRAIQHARELEVRAMSREDKELRERKRNVAYDNLEGRLKIQNQKEKL